MLEKIKTPKDVKRLSITQLQELAEDVRKRIIKVTAKTGGHVAPSLGATDLAIALLKMFDPLEDRIVWDVGHQSYAYKILTERNEQFETLRQFGGLSGFNNIFESEYDSFGVGHASTSISAALGIAVAKEMKGENGRTIAVIGDGALTGGMSFEALNHTGHLQKNIIVVLNDNNFSISKNVGALQSHLTNMLVSKPYNATKSLIYDFVQHLPHRIRRRVILSARTLEENMVHTLAPNIIFEDLGFKYLGPIDGHDIPRMIRIFHKIKINLTGPILMHIVTQKGKGYEYAEDDAARFHGLGPYEIETGKSKKKKGETYSKVFGNTLCEIAEKNKNVVAITAAMTDGTGLAEFAEKFPDKFFDVAIAEQHAVTFAGGLAVQGIKPFVAIYSTFLQRALDQVIHDIALQKLPVVFCLDRAGLVGDDGATHHGVFDLSYLNLIPGLLILIPANAEELAAMLEFAAEYKDGPIVIRYPRGCAKYLNKKIKPIEIGKSVIVHKGKDVAIIGVGKAMEDAEIVYNELKDKLPNIDPYLINPRFLKPLDVNLFNDLEKKVHTIITIEDNALIGGFGDTVKSYCSNTNIKVFSFGIPDEFIEHGTVDQLKNMIGITPKKITKEIISILK
ncbi:MAG: 1-deoxy-D-xylulose-5-phosphate synthase [Candidatus Cloacimonetes bacterium]|nr:1-deoxy-D-xylulose-5-phosphate synthase [Candidatus Cloacimonadota bacterium]